MTFRKYKNPFYLLILLGFICQSFATENYLLPLVFSAFFWFVGINIKRDKILFSRTLEAFIFLCALIIFFKFGGDNYFYRCLALGNAFIILQVIRILGPLDLRDQLFSVAMAMTQIAVGSQVILGYSFILVIIAVIWLLPNTLLYIHKFNFSKSSDSSLLNSGKNSEISTNKNFSFLKFPATSMETITKYFIICFVAVVFFLLLPRSHTIADLDLIGKRFGHQLQKPELEMSFGGDKWSSEELLFKVYGRDIGYLKSFSLDTFDGNVWSAHDFSYRQIRNLPRNVSDEDLLYRKVSIESPDYNRLYLPTDGDVKGIRGSFFFFAKETAQGNVTILFNNKNKINRVYEYWTTPQLSKKLFKYDRLRYMAVPDMSPKLKRWLDNVIDGETDKYKIAKKVENFLKNNYFYEIGTPELNREYPVEDLIFNKKKGHCARFASALAVLLRMKGIPTRVAVGYYTMEKNEIADYYRVRGNNAHAWVEAYIDGTGWITLDATPYATQRYHYDYLKNRTLYSEVYDWIEYVWYGKIISFSQGEQTAVVKWLASILMLMVSNIKYIVSVSGFLLILFIIFYFSLKLRSFFSGFRFVSASHEKQIEFAGHFYGRMLKLLAARKVYKCNNQTPFEFLDSLKEYKYQDYKSIKILTDVFCSVKYGNKSLSEKDLNIINKALKTIKK